MKHSCLKNTQERVNDWIASGFAFAMTGRSFTRLLVNLFTYSRMKKWTGILMIFFCLGIFSLQAKTELKQGLNDYNPAAENYSASKLFGTRASTDNGGEALSRAPKKPSEPGVPIGSGLGIISLCSMVYFLFQSRKKKEKTI
jgi:hypothetical protein